MSEVRTEGIRPVWIASYPRSGNTFLRIILQNIFRQRTYSIYRVEGQNFPDPSAEALETAPFLPQNWRQSLTSDPSAQRLFIKTHDAPEDEAPSIYMVRDGRAAIDSYFHYHQKFAFEQPSLTAIIAGACQFGNWSDHYLSWRPRTRPNTLLLRYEDVVAKPEEIIPKLAEFLQLEPQSGKLPSFDELKSRSPAFFRRGHSQDFLPEWTPGQIALFNECHGSVMQELGYALMRAGSSTAGATLELARTAARSHQLYLQNLAALGASAASQQQLHAQVARLTREVERLSREVLLPLARNPWVRLGKAMHIVPQTRGTNGS